MPTLELYTEQEIDSFTNIAFDLGGRVTQRETTPDGAMLVRITIGQKEITLHDTPDETFYLEQ